MIPAVGEVFQHFSHVLAGAPTGKGPGRWRASLIRGRSGPGVQAAAFPDEHPAAGEVGDDVYPVPAAVGALGFRYAFDPDWLDVFTASKRRPMSWCV